MSHKVALKFHDTAQKEPFVLSYELLDRNFAERWIAALLTDYQEHEPLNYLASGSLFVDEEKERSAIDGRIQDLEQLLQTDLVKTPLRAFATHEDLAPLKARCLDLLSARTDDTDRQILERKKLSDLIHAVIHYESLYHPDHHFQCDIKVRNERRYFFKKHEFDLFTPNRNDGWLYLDYGQTGLPPMTAYLANSNEMPTPQDSFIGSFQIIYRDDFEYSDEEQQSAREWLTRRLKRRHPHKRDRLGQIPLGRPLHSFTRIEVLKRLQTFEGAVTLEVLDGDQILNRESLKHELKAATRSLVLYYPYPPFSLPAFRMRLKRLRAVLLKIWGQRWRLIQPFHNLRPALWNIGFKAIWPLRKIYYFGMYFVTKGKLRQLWAGIFAATSKWILFLNDRLIVQPFHHIRPKLWSVGFKATWPLRKACYFGKHVVRTYILKKKS